MITENESQNEIDSLRSRLAEAEKKIAFYLSRDSLAQQVANIGYWNFTPSTGELYWSPEVLPLLSGLPSGEMDTTYENFIKFVYPDDQKECNRIITEATETNSPFGVEYRVVHVDGSMHWIYEWGGPIDSKDSKQRMIGAVVDITERKNLEIDLKLKNRELQNALDTIKTLRR